MLISLFWRAGSVYVSSSYNLRHMNYDARVVHRHMNYETNINRHMKPVLFSETSSQCCSQAHEASTVHRRMKPVLLTGTHV